MERAESNDESKLNLMNSSTGSALGEAYLRHNGKPAKIKFIRADINPPADFDLSEDLPRFSLANESPLNLTEKVNWVVMDRMWQPKKIGPQSEAPMSARKPHPWKIPRLRSFQHAI